MMMLRKIRPATMMFTASLLAAAVLLSGCATRPPASDPLARAEFRRINDPLEPLNRATFDFNMTMDRFLLKPVSDAYRWVVPSPIRRGISNVLDNLQSPLIFANDLLQGEFDRGGVTLARFITNSTVGVAGIFDPAAKWGLEKHKEDLGETFAVWGVGEGFYLVLPFFGPSNPRDALGVTAEFFGDPVSLLLENNNLKEVSYARTGLEVVDFRLRYDENIKALKRTEGDLYVLMRTAYRQNRAYRISNGRGGETKQEEELFDQEMK
ncbi:MlaA family lipoprotein [Govanella unica]|uniref:VacJ family lipoprotein n=1 Tax=Govanella unica TaxID=2975056 RepID=A0A9X3Z8H0_9PROT|nr:VacJ family lipoprotein [Govania unica]MDA5195061.1 VacJ family lipoprotein [Govania unica]